jgi:hypothetical protein
MCDFEPPEFYSVITRKARKQHHCFECSNTINPKEKYTHVSGKWEGTIQSFSTCHKCTKLWNHIGKHDNCLVHGQLYDTIWNMIESDIKPGQCLIETGIDWLQRGKGGKFELVDTMPKNA